eukprot:1329520-Amorphochlora_amoeboformis.AAC.1
MDAFHGRRSCCSRRGPKSSLALGLGLASVIESLLRGFAFTDGVHGSWTPFIDAVRRRKYSLSTDNVRH